MTMLAQRPPSRGPAVRAVAEALPLTDHAFDAALAVLTVHHWRDAAAGIGELARVARRQLVVTWDPEVSARFWLLRDYLPALRDHEATLPSLGFVEARLDVVAVTKLLVPRGCLDGFMGASWADPSRYLDPTVRASMSGVSLIDQRRVDDALERLARDLDDGTWRRRNAELEALDAYDAGYRLVVAGASPGDSSRNRPTP